MICSKGLLYSQQTVIGCSVLVDRLACHARMPCAHRCQVTGQQGEVAVLTLSMERQEDIVPQ